MTNPATNLPAQPAMLPIIAPQLSAEQLFDEATTQRLADCWSKVVHHYVTGVRGCRLHWLHLPHPMPQGRAVLVPGRIEAAHKYLETMLDLHAAGYDVWSIDHRGQGESTRETANPHLGYVADFDDYCLDLQQLLRTLPSVPYPTLALAHSMGGAILYRTLQLFGNHDLLGAIFCSPMFGIQTEPVPHWLARPLAQLMKQFVPSTFVPGQQNYVEKPFVGNDLTQCEPRYRWFRQLYKNYPQYQLGGISWNWLSCALNACEQISTQPAPQLPICLIQAGGDRVVDNQAQATLGQRHGLAFHCVAGAEHELLAGTDAQREQTYAAINQWLVQLSQPLAAAY